MRNEAYIKGFLPYGAAALLVGLVGGFSAVLGPAFVKDLGIPYNNAAWTALATAISSAALAPVMGRFADAMGRQLLLILGVVVYTLGNVLTAVAFSLGIMLLARFVVGIGMAAIAPVVMGYILTEFPQDRIAKGFSMYMLISSASVVIGPTAGQWIISRYGWRAMIWVCTALCAVILAYCAVRREEETRTGNTTLAGFDWSGAALILLFFGLALCIPTFGQNYGWTSSAFRMVLLAGGLSLLGLILAEHRAENPILPLSFLRRKTFLLSVLALFLTQGLMQANMTNTIVFVEYTQPENSVVSGYAISVMYIGMALGAALIGPRADRAEPKNVLTLSLLLTLTGSALMLLFTRQTPVLLLMLSLGLLGFGLGGNGTIFMKVVFSDLNHKDSGAGTGTYGLFRDLAAPFGVAVLVPMFANSISGGVGLGLEEGEAALRAIRQLAITECVCTGIGIGVVRLLPRVRSSRE